MLAVIALVASQRFDTTQNPEARDMSQRAASDQRIPLAGQQGAQAGAVRAPDISSMTPKERADRLFDRIMRLASEGKRDSVALFATMAIPAFEALGPLDLDQRYDLGRVAEVSGNLDIASAQSDTILSQNPTHLLGLLLGARAAHLEGDTLRRDALERRLLAAESAEMKKPVEEYQRHQGDIVNAVTAAKSRK